MVVIIDCGEKSCAATRLRSTIEAEGRHVRLYKIRAGEVPAPRNEHTIVIGDGRLDDENPWVELLLNTIRQMHAEGADIEGIDAGIDAIDAAIGERTRRF